MNVLKLISSTNACMLVIIPCHNATSSCHVIMPHQHAMSSYHIIMLFSMPHHHAMSACHIIMQYQHAMSPCHVIMPHHHTMSTCHIIMPHNHDTLSFHVIRMHFFTTTWQLEGVPHGISAKIFPVGAKLQNAISFASGVCLTRRLHRWNWIDDILNIVPFLFQYDDF